jgi:capsular polysaccharide transport system permease protein
MTMAVQDVLTTQGRVLYALMLRDVRTKFFGNGLGFIALSIFWPLVHILILLLIYA